MSKTQQYSAAQAAKDLGCSKKTVLRWCERESLGVRLGEEANAPVALSAAEVGRLRELVRQGAGNPNFGAPAKPAKRVPKKKAKAAPAARHSRGEAEKILGCAKTTVIEWCKREGIGQRLGEASNAPIVLTGADIKRLRELIHSGRGNPAFGTREAGRRGGAAGPAAPQETGATPKIAPEKK